MELYNNRSRKLESGLLGVCQSNWMHIPLVKAVEMKAGLYGLLWTWELSYCNLMIMCL